MLFTVGLIVLVFGGSHAKDCSQLLDTLHLADPAHTIGHSIHSLTLNMIRHYFYPNATENNGIPTVNLNRSEENHLNDNAIFVNLTNSMDNYGPFFSIDMILSNMDNKMYGTKNANILDRIAHAMHMQKIWEHASKFYKEILTNPPEKKTCTCLIDTYQEDILKKVLIFAKLIRIPEIMAAAGGMRTRSWTYRYRYRFSWSWRLKASEGRGEEDPSKSLFTDSIADEKTWDDWKNGMEAPYDSTDDVGRDMAYYMYCHFNAA